MTIPFPGNSQQQRKIDALTKQVVKQWNSYWKWIGGAGITIKVILHIYSTITTGEDGIKFLDILHLLVVLLLAFLFFAVFTTVRYVFYEPRNPSANLTSSYKAIFNSSDRTLALIFGIGILILFTGILYLNKDVRFFLLRLPQVSDCAPTISSIPRAIVANIAEAGQTDTLSWEEDIYEKILASVQSVSPYQVCRLEAAPNNVTQAVNIVQLHDGFVLVWGRHQAPVTQISISLPKFRNDLISPLSLHAAEWSPALDYTLILESIDKVTIVVDLIAAHRLSEDNQFSEALNLVDKLIEEGTLDSILDSDDADFYFWIGMLNQQPPFQETNIRRAIDYYSRAILHDKNYWLAYLNRAAAYDFLNMYSEAKSDLTVLIEQEEVPSFRFDAYIGRAKIYEKEDDNSHALADYDAAIAIDPTNGLLTKGQYWLNHGDANAAVKDLQAAWNLSPTNEDVSIWLIMAYIETGEEMQAVALLQQALNYLDADSLDFLAQLLTIAEGEQNQIAPKLKAMLP